jgi:endonuclease/exonuclease/phosphatase family metal-dependent hydrolase
MKIATWNLERPTKTSKRNPAIIDSLLKINADILILTETNEIINLGDRYTYFHTAKLEGPFYKEGERRVSIYSKYKSLEHIESFRRDTSICERLQTPLGSLAVYGTVIGIFGNRNKGFMEDLDQQLLDFGRVTEKGDFCLAGDLNISYSDNYYFTKEGRSKLNASFEKLKLINLTAGIAQNIDHIIVSRAFVGDRPKSIKTWNDDKRLSDHIGVAVEIETT